MTVEEKKKLEDALKEISDGVGGTLARNKDVEVKVDSRVKGIDDMSAKFEGLEKDTKEMTQKLVGFEGQLITMADHLKQRKLGISGSVPGLEEELKHDKRKFSLGRVMACMGMIYRAPHDALRIWEKYAPFENEVQKALDTGTGGAGGGYIVPQEYMVSEFVDLMRANLVVREAGARVLTGLTGSPVKIPAQLSSSTPYWVGQNATITLSNPTFGEASFTPKIMAMRAQISNLEILLSNPDVENLVRQDFASVAALELDRVALRGAGTLEPLGIANTPSIPTFAFGTNGDRMTFDHFLDIEGVLEDKNGLKGNLAFITSAKVKRLLKKTRIPQFSGDTGGMYLMPPVMSNAQVQDMAGYPIYCTTQLPTNLTKAGGTDLTELYFGNWSDLIVAFWGGLEVLATNVGGNAWAQNAVEIRLVQNTDVHVRRLDSFVYASDVQTVA